MWVVGCVHQWVRVVMSMCVFLGVHFGQNEILYSLHAYAFQYRASVLSFRVCVRVCVSDLTASQNKLVELECQECSLTYDAKNKHLVKFHFSISRAFQQR